MGDLLTDETRSIVAGALVDAVLFALAVACAVVFVFTGGIASFAGALWVGNAWARDVGNRPCAAPQGDGDPDNHEFAALDAAVILSWKRSGVRIGPIELAPEVRDDFKDHLSKCVERWNNILPGK